MEERYDQTPHHWRQGWQRIENAHAIPPRRSQRECWAAVTVRLVWERDGVELVDTHAMAWSGRLVLVQVADARYQLRGAWLDAGDVERR